MYFFFNEMQSKTIETSDITTYIIFTLRWISENGLSIVTIEYAILVKQNNRVIMRQFITYY